jgi:hypothetical protein
VKRYSTILLASIISALVASVVYTTGLAIASLLCIGNHGVDGFPWHEVPMTLISSFTQGFLFCVVICTPLYFLLKRFGFVSNWWGLFVCTVIAGLAALMTKTIISQFIFLLFLPLLSLGCFYWIVLDKMHGAVRSKNSSEAMNDD